MEGCKSAACMQNTSVKMFLDNNFQKKIANVFWG